MMVTSRRRKVDWMGRHEFCLSPAGEWRALGDRSLATQPRGSLSPPVTR